MTKFRRIEINGFHRRVTIVSREWPRAIIRAELAEIDDSASRNDTDSCESVAPDSPEGQLILVEEVRFLERRFGPPVPNLSRWRRRHTGDLTQAFNFAAPADSSVPALPAPSRADQRVRTGAAGGG